jgi:hypothetical protein
MKILIPHSVEITLFGLPYRCLDLPTLIRVKRAAGRPKDLDAISELQAILEEPSAGNPSTDRKPRKR